MNSRCIRAIAGDEENWPQAGDNFLVDLDLSEANLQAGDQLTVGTAIIEITDVDHASGGKITQRYGRAAYQLMERPELRAHRLRSLFARVVMDGFVQKGDSILKCQPQLWE